MNSFLFLDSILFIASIYFLQRIISKRRSLPPGPRGLPLIGNVFDMPSDRPWLTFAKWADIYGMRTTIGFLILLTRSIFIRRRLFTINVWSIFHRPQLTSRRLRTPRQTKRHLLRTSQDGDGWRAHGLERHNRPSFLRGNFPFAP